ncbi:SDR family oxidoreductase [Piscinibacter sakaiensis]|uniref:SDR family oxidoreductase n=1 Tax=Piscinibacter sakaiensis TaxID=1547922 RepID=UPI003AACB772
MKVFVIGASRGLGHEFVAQYLADGAVVCATARSEADLAALKRQGARALTLDVTRAESVARLAWQLDGERFDTIVYCPGIYGPRSRGLEPPTEADFDAVMHTNVLGAMRVLPQLADMLSGETRIAVISSRMGAIGPRSSNAGWLYRASKTALNSVLKDLATEWSGRAVCVSLHPGWVRTDMGGGGADLAVADSVADMRRLIASLTARDNGRFINHDGAAIDW